MGVETMIAATLIQGAMQYGQGKSNASSIRSQGRIADMMNDFKREQLETQKGEVLAQGDIEAHERQKQLKSMLGAQKVAFAAQGIEVEGELGYELEEDARATAQADVKAIKNNAWKNAMGIEMDQQDLALQKRFDNMKTEAAAQDAYAKGVSGAIQSGVKAYGAASDAGLFRGGGGGPKSIPSKNVSMNYKRGSLTSRLA
jgi:hypothetical protein